MDKKFVSSGSDIRFQKAKVRGEWTKEKKGVHRNGNHILIREGKKYVLYEYSGTKK